jgi:hypothetical protein
MGSGPSDRCALLQWLIGCSIRSRSRISATATVSILQAEFSLNPGVGPLTGVSSSGK